MIHRFRIAPAGDACLIVRFDGAPGVDRIGLAMAAAAALAEAALADVLDVVPTMWTVGVYFDPVHTDSVHLTPFINDIVAAVSPLDTPEPRLVSVPVCYGGVYGPDLAEVAAFAGLTEQDVVSLHAGSTYRVGMLGFAPGFAYMTAVDPRIAMPRRSEPRLRVPAGSVGIAGVQTSIYPFDSPGGWRLIARTPVRLCDFARADPFLFAPGDRVRFEPIDAGTFERLSLLTSAAAQA